MTRRQLHQGFSILLLACVLVAGRSDAKGTGTAYLQAQDVPLLQLLPPPPAKNSEITNKELAEVFAMQGTWTEPQKKHAVDDAEETPFRFLAGMDVAADKGKLPLTAALFERLSATEDAIVQPTKADFYRPRPPLLNDAIKPLVRLSPSGSYPSGHATFGTITGIVLASMLPEKRDAIFARVRDYAQSRLIVGVHYRGDLDAGYLSGTAIMAVLMTKDAFRKDFEAAKVELRAALGL